jgi:hypothetical protein
MNTDENCIEDGFDIILEHFAWLLGWMEGCIVGCIMSHETKHAKHRPSHEFTTEMMHGFKRGCPEGVWLGGHT